jgi:hypothetical protein
MGKLIVYLIPKGLENQEIHRQPERKLDGFHRGPESHGAKLGAIGKKA